MYGKLLNCPVSLNSAPILMYFAKPCNLIRPAPTGQVAGVPGGVALESGDGIADRMIANRSQSTNRQDSSIGDWLCCDPHFSEAAISRIESYIQTRLSSAREPSSPNEKSCPDTTSQSKWFPGPNFVV